MRELPVSDRLRIVEELWNSIVDDQADLPDHPGIVEELRVRKARFDADPASGIPWESARARIQSERA